MLEIVTRAMQNKRPTMLARNQASLQRLNDSAWVQTLLVDEEGIGVGAAAARLAGHRALAQWVWLLDDDDECIYPDLVGDVHSIAIAAPETTVIMVRMDHGPELGILPNEAVWGLWPLEGHLGCSSYIVRMDAWERHRHAWQSARYASDYDFIADVCSEAPVIYWHDVVASRTQRGPNMGAAE